MRLLLDTHIAIWWMAADTRLSTLHRELIDDRRNQVFVSAISVAEVSIKTSLGKLQTPGDLEEVAVGRGFTMLSFSPTHARRLAELPLLHRDSFDRMLISQAQADGLTFLTADARCHAYDIETL